MKNAVIVAAIGEALPIADRITRGCRRAAAPAQPSGPGKDEKDLGRSEEKIEQTNIPNGLWYLWSVRVTCSAWYRNYDVR